MTPQESSRYQAHKDLLMEKCCRVVAALGAVLFPAYYFIDAYAHREKLSELTTLRIFTTVIFCIVFVMIRKNRFIISPRKLIFTLLIFAAASITGMCWLTGGYTSPVYAGVNLVILTGALTYPVGALGMGFLVSGILGVYFSAVLVQAGFTIAEPAILINNSYFLLCTGIISVATAHLSELLRQESFLNFMQVESAQKDLKRQNEIKSRFFSNVTHELRTPLTLIMGPLKDLMSATSLSEKDSINLKVAERNAQVLLKHVGDLLDVAKLESGEETLKYTRTNLSNLMYSVASQFEHLAQDKEIRYSFDIAEDVIVELDPQKVERVLANLISNAFKFTPKGGKIHCSLALDGKENVVFKICDSGPGIPDDLKQSVFERFYQVEESETRSYGGTGLGLSIVQEFVLLHKGNVSVINSSLGGAEFIVELPLSAPKGVIVETVTPEESTAVKMEVYQLQKHKTEVSGIAKSKNDFLPLILVVEDNQDMRQYIVETLSEKFRVAQATNGKEGLQTAAYLMPDLILSDVMMPEFSGIDLIRALRSDKNPELAATPLIFLTARSDEELRLNLLKEGANDYILKPFSSDELLLRINNLTTLKRSRDILKVELKSTHDDVENLAREITSALAQARKSEDTAQKALQLREDFISLVSHELKTPLTSLKLMTQLTLKKIMSSEAEANPDNFKIVLNHNDHQLERLSRVVNDMLDLSRIKYDNLKLTPSRCNLHELVNKVVNATSSKAAGQKITVVCEKELSGDWDPFRTEQVIQNLLTNALKYGKDEDIEIRVSERKGEALLSVKDKGIGIQPEKLSIIFDQFARAVHSNDYPGLGLGLYISMKIAEAHKGKIEVVSVYGQGSTFTLHLPL